MLIEKKVIIVTGGGGGLGESIARVCHREGAVVVIADVRSEEAQAVASCLGDGAMSINCDVRSDEALHGLVEKTVSRFGRLDGVVNNAGIGFYRPFYETTSEDWERIISVDLRAVFFLTQIACRQMRAQDPRGGSIVNISSVHSQSVLPGWGPYDAAKWGVVGMGKSIAVELASENIRVNTVSPGLLDTPMWREQLAVAKNPEECLRHWEANIPMGRVINPEEVGELVAFLLSERSSCITGSNIFADGGMSSQLTSKEPKSDDLS